MGMAQAPPPSRGGKNSVPPPAPPWAPSAGSQLKGIWASSGGSAVFCPAWPMASGPSQQPLHSAKLLFLTSFSTGTPDLQTCWDDSRDKACVKPQGRRAECSGVSRLLRCPRASLPPSWPCQVLRDDTSVHQTPTLGAGPRRNA